MLLSHPLAQIGSNLLGEILMMHPEESIRFIIKTMERNLESLREAIRNPEPAIKHRLELIKKQKLALHEILMQEGRVKEAMELLDDILGDTGT